MSRKILGLDIRSSSATAVVMETGLKKCAVTGYSHVPFTGEGSYQEQLSEALSTISGKLDLKDCICAVSIPSNRFFYRNVSVPFSETKKIQQMLPYELESVVPFPVEDLLIDFNKTPVPGDEGETRIIAAGIETGRLKALIDAVEACGFSTSRIFPSGYSTAGWLCAESMPRSTVLFVEFDGVHCSLYLLLKGNISLIRSFPLPPDQAKTAIRLWSYLQRSVAGFESLFEVKVSPDTIIINGFTGDNFAKQLETVSSVAVETLHMRLPDRCEAPGSEKEVFSPEPCYNGALSCVLSLLEGFRGMNFRKGALAAKNRLVEYKKGLIRTAAIAAGVILLWIVGAVAEVHIAQKKVDNLQAQIHEIFKSHFPNNPNTAEPAHQMRTRMETLKKAAFDSGETTSQIRSIDLLRDVSRVIPENANIRFSKFNLSDDGIYIDGTTGSYQLVDEIKSKIESLNTVASVTSSPSSRDGDNIRFKFRIETGLEEAS